MRPIVLAIAGSDPCGGAGIQGDSRAIEACGGWAATAITAVTWQNSRGVRGFEALAPAAIRAQLDAVLDDLDVAAVKSGMLPSAGAVEAVAAALARLPAERPYVLDPVLAASDGSELCPAAAREALIALLLPRAAVITPNAREAEALAGLPVNGADDAEAAGRRLLARGARAVLVKGGHGGGRDEERECTDVLVEPAGTRLFRAARVEPREAHGTGCCLASALATLLARGQTLHGAVEQAKALVTAAIRHAAPIGRGRPAADAGEGARARAEQGR